MANAVTEYVPSARPGERAPHRWLRRHDGTRISTLDLFGHDFSLLTAGRGDAWHAAVAEISRRRAVPLRAVHIAPGAALEDESGGFAAAFGIAEDGAVLVRPDGHVAFRSPAASADPVAALDHAFDVVLRGHTVPARASESVR